LVLFPGLWLANRPEMSTSDWSDFHIPVKVPLGGGRYAELTEWNASKRVDLRFWKTDTIPTKVGVSLSLPQWKVLYTPNQHFVLLLRKMRGENDVTSCSKLTIKRPH
jgi:hypothetical protein